MERIERINFLLMGPKRPKMDQKTICNQQAKAKAKKRPEERLFSQQLSTITDNWQNFFCGSRYDTVS